MVIFVSFSFSSHICLMSKYARVVCACAHVCACIVDTFCVTPKVNIECLPLLCSTLFPELGSLRSLPVRAPSTLSWVPDMHCQAQLFMWVLGIWTQDLIARTADSLFTELPPQPQDAYFYKSVYVCMLACSHICTVNTVWVFTLVVLLVASVLFYLGLL